MVVEEEVEEVVVVVVLAAGSKSNRPCPVAAYTWAALHDLTPRPAEAGRR
jgi:hypothetical protein